MKPFESFRSIERLNQPIIITEKIHGSNAQITIENGEIYTGSRSRWITPEDDNFGFAKWVAERKELFLELLGEGQHFGEWYGSGINAGYGLKERRFALFNTTKWEGLQNSPVHKALGIDVVPVLYSGPYDSVIIDKTFQALKESGSVMVPGYNRPEGIVVFFTRSNMFLKRTFEAEDAAWTYTKERPVAPNNDEISAICAPFWHPMRLEKLLSREQVFTAEYPSSLPVLCKAYMDDLVKETEIPEDVLKLVKKNAFKAIKGMMLERGYTA